MTTPNPGHTGIWPDPLSPVQLKKDSSHNTDGSKKHYHPTNDVHRFALDNELDSLQFNIVKYVTRFKKKNGLDDLLKARNELARLIEENYGSK